MSFTVYRLTKYRHRDQIFSGLGAMHAQGRWTARGRPVVYTSESISLAVLEYTLNYRRKGWIPATVLGRAVIPADVTIEIVMPADLPRNWYAADAPPALREIGEDWLERAATAVLKVPSAVVVEEWNYLLNPRHPHFEKIERRTPEAFDFDRRVARTRKK